MSNPPAKNLATLLVSCPDRRGIVAALAQLLYGLGANLLDSDQHTDTAEGQFFQRIRFDMSEPHTDRNGLTGGLDEAARRFDMTWRLSFSADRKRVAIFVSKYDHCLYDLLLRHRAGELSCDISLIISNHPDLKPIAEHFGIDYHHLPVSPGRKAEQEAQGQGSQRPARHARHAGHLRRIGPGA